MRIGPEGRIGVVAVAASLAVLAHASPGAGERPGVPPETPWACPDSHPIKGYASTESGRRVYYMPGSRFYEEASPERCYASEDEARRDGNRPARDPDAVTLTA
jgi:hypothetical protein